jgi:NAD(P)-dependent dehydrogenase (short-subunit alcohol dehydrogenase family)
MGENLFDLKDQVALITGGSGVLGTVFARALADQGAKIVIADIDEERCKGCAAGITKESGKPSLGVLLDVSDPKAVESAVGRAESTFGRIDILNIPWRYGIG